jgi:hypothetical protein
MSTRIDPKEKLAGLLEGCTLQALASNEWLERRIMPLFIDQLRWRPRPGSWSIAETLDHLNRTFSYYLPKIEEARAQAGRIRRDVSPADGAADRGANERAIAGVARFMR